WDASEDLKHDGPDGPETGSGSLARRVAVVAMLGLSEQAEAVLRDAVPVHVHDLVVISREFEPWYDEVRHTRSTRYWDDYESYLTQVKQWPASPITTLDQSTSAVVERLTDPTRAEIMRTRGLVVGYVQSGKTANFTGVIAKAIDAGYRLIIVMTGTIEMLRSQTQRRIDKEMIGRQNIVGDYSPEQAIENRVDYQDDEDWLA